MSFYIDFGTYFTAINIGLLIICAILVFKKIPYENSKRILFYPCLVFAIFSGLLIYATLSELFIAYYSGGKYELEAYKIRISGPYAWLYRMHLLGITLPLFLFLPMFRKTALQVLVITGIALASRLFDYLLMLIN
jgi:hypothetical protein